MRNIVFIVALSLLTSAFDFPSFNTNTFPLNLIFGEMENGLTGPSLETLGVDVLSGICQIIDDTPPSEFEKAGGKSQKPLVPLSKTSRMLRDLSAPALFREVVIRGDWERGMRMLDRLRDCPAITRYTKTFKFDLFVPEHKKYKPAKRLPPLLAEVVKQMGKLTKLVLVIPEFDTEVFEEAFKEARIVLPGVETLVVGPYCEFVVGMCPNVSVVATNGWSWQHSERQRNNDIRREHTINLINAVAAAENVTRLEINEYWDTKLLESVLEVKSLKYLAMEGGHYEKSFPQFLPLLSKMTTLHTLALTDASNLGVRFDPPDCGNVYMGPGGDEYLKQVMQEGKEAEDKIAGMVCEAIGPHLKQLWVSEWTRFEILRDEVGVLQEVIRHSEQRDQIVSFPSP